VDVVAKLFNALLWLTHGRVETSLMIALRFTLDSYWAGINYALVTATSGSHPETIMSYPTPELLEFLNFPCSTRGSSIQGCTLGNPGEDRFTVFVFLVLNEWKTHIYPLTTGIITNMLALPSIGDDDINILRAIQELLSNTFGDAAPDKQIRSKHGSTTVTGRDNGAEVLEHVHDDILMRMIRSLYPSPHTISQPIKQIILPPYDDMKGVFIHRLTSLVQHIAPCSQSTQALDHLAHDHALRTLDIHSFWSNLIILFGLAGSTDADKLASIIYLVKPKAGTDKHRDKIDYTKVFRADYFTRLKHNINVWNAHMTQPGKTLSSMLRVVISALETYAECAEYLVNRSDKQRQQGDALIEFLSYLLGPVSDDSTKDVILLDTEAHLMIHLLNMYLTLVRNRMRFTEEHERRLTTLIHNSIGSTRGFKEKIEAIQEVGSALLRTKTQYHTVGLAKGLGSTKVANTGIYKPLGGKDFLSMKPTKR
jgi:hypothetical protein